MKIKNLQSAKLSNILSLSQHLISIASTKDNPQVLNKTLEVAKKELKGYTIEQFEKDGVPSLLAYNTPSRPKKFKVILNAHLDVVPAKESQYKPVVKNGKLYGRGAYDMKAASAVEILVFKELAKTLPYPIALQLVTDEEIGGFKGTKHQIEKGVKANFVIAGEPTDFGINNQAKGIIWTKIKTKGTSAHGAYLWQGDNALWKAQVILERLKKAFPVPKKEIWKTTVNLAKITTSNQTFNKVPDDAEISLDIRYVPKDKEKIIKRLKDIIAKDGQLELILNEPDQFTDKRDPYLTKLRKAVEKITKKKPQTIVKHGGSDIRHYNQVQSPGVTFGPEGYGLHTDNEWVDIKSLKTYYQILKDFLLTI